MSQDQPNRKAVRKGKPPMVHPEDPLKLKGGLSPTIRIMDSSGSVVAPLPPLLRHPADIEFQRKVELAEVRLAENVADGQPPYTYCQYRVDVFAALEQLRRALS